MTIDNLYCHNEIKIILDNMFSLWGEKLYLFFNNKVKETIKKRFLYHKRHSKGENLEI